MENQESLIDSQIKKHKFIVFCQDHYNPLGICRSLGEKGIEPIVVTYGKEPSMLRLCKYVKQIYIEPTANDALNFIIATYGNEDDKPFLLTGADDTTQLLDQNYNKLIDKFYFFNCGKEGRISEFMDKERICEIAEKNGIPKPKGEVLKKGEYPKSLKYPVITKVTMSTKGAWKKDVFVCNDEVELKEAYNHIKADELLVQEFIEKKNELCVDGISIKGGEEVLFPYTSEYIRFHKQSYGEYMYILPYNNDKVRESIQKILKETHFSGIFSLECLIDKKDDIYFLEVNFRNSTWSYAYTYAGLNLPYQWAKATLLGHIDKTNIQFIDSPFTAMVEPSDFLNSVIREKQIGFWKWLYQLRKCDVTYYYNKRDRMPLMGFFINRLSTFFKKKMF